MPRRNHKKSKNGCAECKRRHIKCDESRPVCAQCIASERTCAWLEGPVRDHMLAQASSQSSLQLPSHLSHTYPSSSHEDSINPLGTISPVNMMHVELLHHFASEINSIFETDFNDLQVSFSRILQHCLSAPYLMNEILALSSLHLSVTCSKPEQKQIYRHRASHMQQHALSAFNTIKPAIEPSSSVPVFLFSSLLGFYMLGDTLLVRNGSFDSFLDSFTRYVRLHQGVRAVVTGCWEYLLQTELAPLIDIGLSIPEKATNISKDLQRLLKLIKSADLEETATNTCCHAIMSLQGVTTAAMSNSSNSNRAMFAWPVIVEANYVDLISTRQPEALVILAHYAILLHRRRDHWVLGDGGKYLIDSIGRYLGPAWDTWLSLPNQCLQQDLLF